MQIRTRLLLTALWMTVFALRPSFAQPDSTSLLRISLLTCSPGEELYSTFGHTAIRVTDATNDLVFNYGTFDFSDPDFYPKFVKGRLEYFLSIEYFNDFYRSYQFENRSIYEQELNLSQKEKVILFQTLLKNAQQENKFYKYDFLLNNCTTKGRDRIIESNNTPPTFTNFLAPETPTFRNLLHEYLARPNQQWTKLGIDLLMGTEADMKLTLQTAMFLPDYLMKGLDHGVSKGQPLAKKPVTLLSNQPPNVEKAYTPLLVFWLLAGFIAIISFTRNKVFQKTLLFFDHSYFFVLGLLGITLCFLWIATDHHAFSKNWNILWAFPSHAAIAFLNFKRPALKNYFYAFFILNIVLLASFFILPQELNRATLPLIFIVAIRSYFLKKQRHENV